MPTSNPDASAAEFDGRSAPLTADAPAAVAVITLEGDVDEALRRVTGRGPWPIGTLRLVDLAGVDRGLAVRLDERVAQLMPHGGPAVVRRLRAELSARGLRPTPAMQLSPRARHPEAADRIEAIILDALADAASPMAVEPLLAQAAIWRERPRVTAEDRERSRRLNRLLVPPTVVLAGPPNVGKSTLINALAGRSVAIAADLPGTTRDHVGVRVDLGGLVVNLFDTPGVREGADTLEADATAIARTIIEAADLLVAVTDHEQPWPSLARRSDLRAANKLDLGRRIDADINVSATLGEGLDLLSRAVRDRLVPPADLAVPGPWVFDERLLEATDSSR